MPRMGPETPPSREAYSFRHKDFDSDTEDEASKVIAISSPPPSAAKAGHVDKSYNYWKLSKQAEAEYVANNYVQCLEDITKAKNAVDSNSNKTANAQYKSIVYYNYSWFVMHLKPKSMSSRIDALSYVEKAINMYDTFQQSYSELSDSKLSENKHYMQDCLVHKGYVLFLLDRTEDAQLSYYNAFNLDAARFVADFTTAGTGRELLFWAVDLGKVIWLDKLLALKSSQEEDGGTSKINPNVSSDMGLSVLMVAVIQSPLLIIEKLLELGANPLYTSEDGDPETPFTYALSHEKWELCQKFINYIKKDTDLDNLRKQIDFEQLECDDAPVELQDRLKAMLQTEELQDNDHVDGLPIDLASISLLDTTLDSNVVDIIGKDN